MFIVLEFWTTEKDAQPQTISYMKETKDEAMSSYHLVLHQAAVSQHLKHGAIIMDDEGRYLARECFIHEQIIPPNVEE